ncbi:DMT family transporter [Bacteroides gallinaceum]|uniref:DMT family transporter n=2 Tax=Bacteroidaceae TaxID=815 RepID=A0ABT7VF55_9BACE|nr:DMT family transporter [Bacteroides gallinaceum]MBU3855431.1 DMT family transporter [Candidatus Phocaeicola excrementipullorum]MBW9200202.1 DMT family transporter [Bacteroidales bacterium SW299]MDM8324918.1 DMT family transporter [Bacteroides gallinaceum]
MNAKDIKAHLALLGAASMWGLMSPVGKAAMEAGVSGLSLANMRMIGAACCFWITSLFVKQEKVNHHDLLMLFFASLLGIVCNQGCFTFGLSLTSPVDASIVTTTMPIVTMILAALFLKEPVTPKKVTGIFLGSVGALVLIMSNQGGGEKEGGILGDALCVMAQVSFACYLTIFKKLIARYNVITLMKWMFTYAAICFIPFSYNDFSSTDWASFPMEVWLEVGYVVLFGTYVAYILMLVGQKTLRPTVVSMYNYMQPVVGSSVAVLAGMASFGWVKGIAAVLIFTGVYVVTQSKSRAQMLAERNENR